MKPATPLPWTKTDGHFQHVRTQDIAYFVHAANAYPKLVEALKAAQGCTVSASINAKRLLQELGEL